MDWLDWLMVWAEVVVLVWVDLRVVGLGFGLGNAWVVPWVVKWGRVWVVGCVSVWVAKWGRA